MGARLRELDGIIGLVSRNPAVSVLWVPRVRESFRVSPLAVVRECEEGLLVSKSDRLIGAYTSTFDWLRQRAARLRIPPTEPLARARTLLAHVGWDTGPAAFKEFVRLVEACGGRLEFIGGTFEQQEVADEVGHDAVDVFPGYFPMLPPAATPPEPANLLDKALGQYWREHGVDDAEERRRADDSAQPDDGVDETGDGAGSDAGGSDDAPAESCENGEAAEGPRDEDEERRESEAGQAGVRAWIPNGEEMGQPPIVPFVTTYVGVDGDELTDDLVRVLRPDDGASLEAAVDAIERSLGPEHPRLADALYELGANAMRQKEHEKAEYLARRVLDILESPATPLLRSVGPRWAGWTVLEAWTVGG